MNFVFISPNYPESFWMFARGLKKYGARVLCIADQPYNSLKQELRDAADEIYVVNSFHDYDAMVKALGYFTFKYGKIDWIESNNEAWLALDARLRDDFNVKTGFSAAQIEEFQSKAAMKKYYEKAGLAVAPYVLVDGNVKTALDFAHKVGYPVVLKPDHGVGASFTYEITSDQQMRELVEETKDLHMILEKYIPGDIITMDGICDAEGKIRFLVSLEYVGNCMDSVQNQDSIGCYYRLDIPEEYYDIAQRVIDSFGLKNRFFHGEYFRLNEDVPGVGKTGDIAGLEVNFRPPGGFLPDLMNYANDMDVYDLWAQILLTQTAPERAPQKYACGFAGRRNSIAYKYSLDDLRHEFGGEILDIQYLPPAFAAAMGDVTVKARFADDERRKLFFEKALARAENHG